MEGRVDLTEDDVIDAWKNALNVRDVVDEPLARTFSELYRKLHVGKDRLRKMLNKALANGIAQEVTVERTSKASKPYTVTAYVLLDIEKFLQ